ncbi:MAG: hypothetical protein SF051_12815 [Elusimicrobiota bacterium]|nr:hypothetical protein [Elusimicrobiota bacterium]
MKALLAAVVLTLPAFADASEREPREGAPAVSEPAAVLAQLLQFAAGDPLVAADLDGLITCARAGGAVGLSVGAADAAVVCERTVMHDRLTDSARVGAGAMSEYARFTGTTVRVVDGKLGYGTGNPAPGGLPSHNFTAITPEHAGPAVRHLIAQRDRLARPMEAASDEPCAAQEGDTTGRRVETRPRELERPDPSGIYEDPPRERRGRQVPRDERGWGQWDPPSGRQEEPRDERRQEPPRDDTPESLRRPGS